MGRNPRLRASASAIFIVSFFLLLATGPDSGRAQSAAHTVLSFGHADQTGSVPRASLIFDAAGILYRTTSAGGSNGLGPVFKLNADGSGYSELHDFTGSNGDGAQPGASLLLGADGALYGTTQHSGVMYQAMGTVFTLNTNGNAYAVVKSFAAGTVSNPYGGLVWGTNGLLYGATCNGGTSNMGAVFCLSTNGTTLTMIKSFTESIGSFPLAALVLGSDGLMYGTSSLGGSAPASTI